MAQREPQEAEERCPRADVRPRHPRSDEDVGDGHEVRREDGGQDADPRPELVGVQGHQDREEEVEMAFTAAREPHQDEDDPQIGDEGGEKDRPRALRAREEQDEEGGLVGDERAQEGTQVDLVLGAERHDREGREPSDHRQPAEHREGQRLGIQPLDRRGRGASPEPDPGDEHGHGGLPARVGVPEARLRLALLTAGQPVVDQHERGPRQHRDDGRPLDQHPDRDQEEPGVLRVTHPGVHAVGDQLPPRSVDAVPPDPHEKEPRQHEPVAHQMNDG